MQHNDLENKKILIVGYGKEGKATEEYLKQTVPSAILTVTDEAQGSDYLSHQEDYDLAIVSPGIPARNITIPFTTATNIFFEHVKGMTIGVTGTKGKSTTTSLIYAILKQAGNKAHLVGNIGIPMLSELLVSNTTDDIWVCELSSYQLETIKYSPHIAVMVSLFPEHMNYHGSVEAYYAAKAQITLHQSENDYFVYNSDFEKLVDLAQQTQAKSVPYVESLPFPNTSIPLLGQHNRNNVRAAVTVGEILKISEADMEEAVRTFHALPHRLQIIGAYKGITFVDDAISTTPESTLAALEAIPNVGTLMLGGLDRGYDFTQLVDALVQYNIPNLVLFPESGKKIALALEKRSEYHPRVLEATSMRAAVSFAYENTPQDMVCLLSTASPSYSLWKNFEAKGDEFQELVKKLGERV